VAHEFLLHLHRSTRLVEQGPKGVAKRALSDAPETATKACGGDMDLLHTPGYHGAEPALNGVAKNRFETVSAALSFGRFELEFRYQRLVPIFR
jgi:hypothetical protein